eukprot:7340161-Alexandrium_andersonii.AAC.1
MHSHQCARKRVMVGATECGAALQCAQRDRMEQAEQPGGSSRASTCSVSCTTGAYGSQPPTG